MTQTNYFGIKCPKGRVWGGSPTSVFAARRDAKIASVATLALLAVSAFPPKGAKNGGCVFYTSTVPLAFLSPSAVASTMVNSLSSIEFKSTSMCLRQSLSRLSLAG